MVTLKGYDLGIKIVKKLINKGYNVLYTIVGDGIEFDNLKKQLKENNIENAVELVGSKDQLEIKKLLSKNHLFLMSSTKDESGRSEAFGVVSLEAQAMGLPVIGFDAGGFPDTIIDGVTGFLVEDKNIQEMVSTIEKLILDQNLLVKMSRQAINNAIANFNVHKTTGQYFKLYG